jgi:transcriptional regulator with XRE-family HTH domain
VNLRSARLRTLPFPANIEEEAVEAVLASLSEAADALLEELGRDVPEFPLIGNLSEDLGRSTRSLIPRWRRLPRASPYREHAIPQALGLLQRVFEAAEAAGPAARDAAAIEDEVGELALVVARLQVGKALRTAREGMSLRAAAAHTGLAVGYLSELEGGQTGLPSDEVCRRLDAALGTKVVPMVKDARQRAAELKDRSRTRRAKGARDRRRGGPLGPRDDARLQAVVTALADDRTLLELTEALIALPHTARRGVQQLMQGFKDAFGPP